MPPKPKYTREEITDAAVALVREKGEAALTARELGSRLGTTSTPIFTAFKNMEEVKESVLLKSKELFLKYREEEIAKNEVPRYKAIGIGYIRFAAEEKNLFRLLFMRDRTNESCGIDNEFDSDVLSTVEIQTGLPDEQINIFHTEMWLFTHGIATMLATSYFSWTPEQIGILLTDAYEAMKARYSEKLKAAETDAAFD